MAGIRRKRKTDFERELAKKISKRNYARRTHDISLLLTTFERWSFVKSVENLRTHNDVAMLLLDTWDLYQELKHNTKDKSDVQSALDTHAVQSSSRQVVVEKSIHVPPWALESLRDAIGEKTDNPIVIKKEYDDEQPGVYNGNEIQRTEEFERFPQFSTTEQSTIRHCYQSESNADTVELKMEVESECSASDNESVLNDFSDKAMEDIRDIVFDTRDKVLPVREEYLQGDNAGSAIKSTRIRSKGYRPNYAALEWRESSDSEESETDDNRMLENSTKDETICYGNEEITDEVRVTDDSEDSADNDNEDVNMMKTSERKCKGKQSKKRNRLDKDYMPSDDEDSIYEDSILSDEDSNYDEYIHSDDKGSNKDGVKTGMKEETKYIKDKRKVTKPNEISKYMAKKKMNWKKIKLEDHRDKYCFEDVESFERQHRKTDVTVKAFSCLVCQHFKCSEESVLSTHIEEHVNKVLECSKCDFVGSYRQELYDHQQMNGHLNASFVCDICGLALDSDTKRKSHRGSVHNIAEYKCPFCGEMFVTRLLKNSHMRAAHPDVCQYCEHCKKCIHTLSPKKFQEHLKKCRSVVQCETCGKEVTAKSLTSHISQSHSNVRKYPCKVCPYTAKSMCSLKRHMRTHNNVHPYCCKLCSFSCIQMSQLQSHMRTHTGEKPFKCSQCKYAAAWKVQLKDHIKVHGMETAVLCTQCEVLFKNNNSLKLHVKRAH